jgi:hypothetical protein
MDDGLLKPQEPLKPGFSGIKNDRVGPGDYDPKLLTKAPVANFQKVVFGIFGVEFGG